MSAHGSIASSHNDPAQHYSAMGAQQHAPTDDPFSSTHDIDMRADAGNKPTDQYISLNTAGVRASGPWPLSPFVQAGQNRITGGFALRRTPGLSLLGHMPRWLDVEYNHTLGFYGSTAQKINYDRIQHGPTRRSPKVHEGRITASIRRPAAAGLTPVSAQTLLPMVALGYPGMLAAAAKNLWPLDLRGFLNWESRDESYDLSTEVAKLPVTWPFKAGNPDRNELDQPEELAESMWIYEHSRSREVGLSLIPRSDMLFWLKPLRPLWGGISKKLHLDGLSFDCSAHATNKMSQSTLRYATTTPAQHVRNLHKHLVTRETWWAFLCRLFNNNILCKNRYNADGLIQFWPKRVWARYVVGERSKQHFSPHNIPHLRTGEQLLYRNGNQASFRAQVGLSLGQKFNKLRIRFPFNFFCGVERFHQNIADASVEYSSKQDDDGERIDARTSCSKTSAWESSAFAMALDRHAKVNAAKRCGTTQSVTVFSSYPVRVRTGDNSFIHNPTLLAVPHSYRDAVGMPVHILGKDIDRTAAVELLSTIRKRAKRADKDAEERDDQKLEVETTQTLPQTTRSAAVGIALHGSGRVYEHRVNVVQGQIIRAEHTDNGFKSALEVFVRAADARILPHPQEETLEVRADVRSNASGQEEVQRIHLGINMFFKPGYTEKNANQMLAKYGDLYKNKLAFPALPAREAMLQKIGNPAVSRDICLTAKINQDQLGKLRKACIDDKENTYKVAQEFGLDPSTLETLTQNGLQSVPFNKSTALALGHFICRQDQPERALKFLAAICGGSWFDVAPNSGTGTAARLAKEAQDLCNTFTLPAAAGAEPWGVLTARLAPIEKLLRRVRQAQKELQDPYVDDAGEKNRQQTLERASRTLMKASAHCKKDMGDGVNIKLTEHLMRTGIRTEDDVLAGCHIQHDVHLKNEIAKLEAAIPRLLTPSQQTTMTRKFEAMSRDLRAMVRGGSESSCDVEQAARAA